MNLKALLSNEFVVLALDALLHLGSVFLLGVIVIIACKLLSKGFVDAKLLTGLIIAGILVAMRVFLLNNAHHLAGLDAILIMAVVGFILFLTCLFLVYKLVSIPVIGTILSSTVIVAAQLALAHYTPVLSLKLMPEGQRFAEYAGVSNEKTKLLMEQAKNFQGESKNNIGKVLKQALATLAFWSSDKEQELLSKNLASGVEFIQERRALMESMSDEELEAYRAEMASFMQEQGIDLNNRYSLENLKNATPEDLQNLANFMKDMNKEFGFTDDLPEGTGDDDDAPPTLESLRQIAKNLQGVKIGGEGGEKFAGLLKDMMSDEDFQNEMDKVRGQIADLKANSGQLMGTFRGADIEGMKQGLEGAIGGNNSNPDVPSFYDQTVPTGRGQKLFSHEIPTGADGDGGIISAQAFESSSSQSIDKALMDLVVFEETGYYPSQSKEATGSAEKSDISNASNGGQDSAFQEPDSVAGGQIDYYIPINTGGDFPEPIATVNSPENSELKETDQQQAKNPPQAEEDTSDYFPASELSNSLTNDYVLQVPKGAEERARWIEVANSIHVGAWFEGTGGANKGTIFIDGIALRSGEIIQREHEGERYYFRFVGVEKGQVLFSSLKRESIENAQVEK